MLQPSRREFLALLAAATAAPLVSESETAVQAEGDGANTIPIVSRHKIVTSSPPNHIPNDVVVDALLLGNGDLLAAFAGGAHQLQFWITANDFWEMRGWGGPRPFGRIVLELPELENARYLVEQDLATASLSGTFTSQSKTVKMTSWVAATENLLIVEMEVEGGEMDGRLSFRFPDELGLGVNENKYWNYDQGADRRLTHPPNQETWWIDGLLSVRRTFHIDTDQATRVAMAARFLERTGTEGNIFRLQPGKRQVFVAALRSWFKTSKPLEVVRERVRQVDAAGLAMIRSEHEGWWIRYWNASLVEINEPSIERQYYRSHYNMGALSGDKEFPPCDYGICTSDDPVCAADYKINYNYQAGFLGLNVAGRLEQTEPYDAPGLAHLSQAEADAKAHFGHGGAYMSLGLGPKGMVAEHIWLGMKSQNAFYLVNTAERWYLTRDLAYARKVYPMVYAVARFWEADLRDDQGRYLVVNDAAHEDSDHDCINSCSGVAFVKMAMRLILDMSMELGLNHDQCDKWQHVLDRVGPIPIKDAGMLHSVFESPGVSLQDVYPKGILAGKEVIVLEEEGIDWSFECSVQTIPIYPAGEIGLDSEPKLLDAARNTVSLRSLSELSGKTWPGPKPRGIDGGAWFDANQGCLFFTAAVRVGHDPEVIWVNLREWSSNRVWPNGFRKGINDGIENYSTIPNAIQEMMLLSHENVIRVFRVWPRKTAPNARFINLWAYGAFRVSATLKGGEVTHILIESHKGRKCTIENPWPAREILLERNGLSERFRGERISVQTRPGETMRLTSA
jgi:alpha-L-fucosidase 2